MAFFKRIIQPAITMAAVASTANILYKNQQATNEMKALSQQLATEIPHYYLSSVLSDHKYNSPKQQMGIMTLLSVNNINQPKQGFNSEIEANSWLKQCTQDKFLRRGERWSPKNKEIEKHLECDHERVIEAASLLNLVQKDIPSDDILKQNHISAIPGALEARFTQRIESLVDEIRLSGTVPTVVVAVTGYRKLQDKECPNLQFKRTEEEMIKAQWKAATQKYPELKNIPFIVSTAELKANQSRSNTVDTVETLAKNDILQKSDRMFVHIEKPYAVRFFPIFEDLLPIEVHMYSQGIDPNTSPLFIYQDETARTIYFNFPKLQNQYQYEEEREQHYENSCLCTI